MVWQQPDRRKEDYSVGEEKEDETINRMENKEESEREEEKEEESDKGMNSRSHSLWLGADTERQTRRCN